MKTKKKRKRLKNIIKYSIISILSICLLAGVAIGGVVLAMIKTAPELDLNSILVLDEPSVLYDNQGQPMDEAPTLVKREVVSLKDIPKNLQYAFISIEDERFESHNGIDIKRIASSAFTDLKNIVGNQDGLNGGSTITQQLLKNTILTNEVSMKRKVQEMYLATQLEKALSKDQILEAYLNTIPLGGTIYGVQEAAQQYFNKNVGQLDLIQCAYIAGVTQNPSRYSYLNDFAKKNPKYYIDRTKTVLYKMRENNRIDEAQYTQAVKDIDAGKLVFDTPSSSQAANRLNYEWFSRPAMDQVKADLIANYHYTSDEVEKLFMYGGLKIYTTMDKNLQDSTQNIINDNKYFGSGQRGNINDINNVAQPQASAVIMDYHTGEVKVIIGGRGQQPANSYNRAASDKYIRPTGSSIKPLTVYSPAIDTKIATAGTVVEDSPLPVEIGKQWPDNGKPYNPKDDEPIFRGYMTIREALRRSLNLVAVKLEYQIGLKTGLAYAEKYGITFNDRDSKSIAALALGQFEGSNTLHMAAAYGTFGNNGVYTSPILYTKVVDKTGKVLLENKPVTRKVLSPQSAYVMYDLLKGPTSSLSGATGSRAKFGDMPISGKTGTTTDKKDLWFCGLTPYLSGSVWIGNDKKEVLG
ncbi:MAG: PBP1A family penicillin-binding protein, partial [Bacillota bacterium]|nr:PBP1A family penicillin-binding protein [Bacillota bacterium]